MLGKLRFLTPYFSKKIAPSGHFAGTENKIHQKYNWLHFLQQTQKKRYFSFYKTNHRPQPSCHLVTAEAEAMKNHLQHLGLVGLTGNAHQLRPYRLRANIRLSVHSHL